MIHSGINHFIKICLILSIYICYVYSAPPQWIQEQRTPTVQNEIGKKIGCISSKKGREANLDCLESFLEDQLNMFGHELGNLPQTYRVGWDYQPPRPGYADTFGYELSMRADVYDSAMAAIFFINRNRLDLARRICDTLIFVTDNDMIGDGRSRASYYPVSPIMNQYIPGVPVSYYTKVKDATVMLGNLAFQVLALGRFYHVTKEYRYLRAATKIMSFINKELRATTPIGGFYGGYGHDPNTLQDVKIEWRSIEHNLDMVSAARFMYGLTNNETYKDMMEHADTFVKAMWNDELGTYHVGTIAKRGDDTISQAHYPVDAVTWKILAEADNDASRNLKGVEWVLNNLVVEEEQKDDIDGKDYNYKGVLFAKGGEGIQSENTGAAAMAFHKVGLDNPSAPKRVKDTANQFIDSLLQMQKHALNSDGNGIVASLKPEGALVWQGDEFAGEAWRYFPFPHTVATAWTALAIQYINGDKYANPYAPFHEKKIESPIITPPTTNPDNQVSSTTETSSSSGGSVLSNAISFTSLGIASIAFCLLVVCICLVIPLNLIFCVRLVTASRRANLKKTKFRERSESQQSIIPKPTDETYATEST